MRSGTGVSREKKPMQLGWRILAHRSVYNAMHSPHDGGETVQMAA